jgi:hypothetical protein
VGLLAVEVSAHGVVMSADSQRVEILGGENRVLDSGGSRSRNPIVLRSGGGFVGLVGFAGTEQIESRPTAEWLRQYSKAWPDDDVGTFCSRLAEKLTDVWRRDGLPSVMEILVTGEVAGDPQFWFVRNSQGLREADLTHEPPASSFVTRNDLDDPLDGYIRRARIPGKESKDDVLNRITFSFRQGVLVPGAAVFTGFEAILRSMYEGRVAGFAPVASLDDLGHFARVRMEFLKRLCTSRYGIYAEAVPTPVGGEVHVFGVGRDGRIVEYRKGRAQTRIHRPARTGSGS